MNERKPNLDGVIGWGVYGSMIAGILGIVGSVLSFLGGNVSASALFLVAAALAFGLLSGALLRQ